MQIRTLRVAAATLALSSMVIAAPAHAFAPSKEIIQLQVQIQQLQDALARLQQSNDERMGVMKDLMQQTTDTVNRMSVAMENVQKQVRTQTDGAGKSTETLSGQMQSLNDTLDELKARLTKIERSVSDVQATQQTISAKLDSSTPGASAGPAPLAPGDATPAPSPAARTAAKPSAGLPAVAMPTTPSAPPVEDLYRTAYGDYNSAKYTLAAAEFSDVIKFYPDSNLAGNAYFYLGEIDYKSNRPASAAKNYDKVLEQYPGNPKATVAQLRKGESLLEMKQTDAGARELRSLIQRYPNSQEAVTARARLSSLGATDTRKPR